MLSVSHWPPMIRVSLRYGLIMGVLGPILLIILYYTSHHPFLIPVYMDYRIILFVIIFSFALKELRDYHQEGVLHFWQGMISSLVMIFIFGLMASGFIYIFALSKPEFVQSYINLSLEQIKLFPVEEIERLGRDVYESGIQSLKEADAYFLATRYFTQSFIISFFISVIISVILRKQPKP